MTPNQTNNPRLFSKLFTGKKRPSRQKDRLLKRQLQWLLLLRVVFLSVLLGLSALLQADERGLFLPPLLHIGYFIGTIYLFSILSAILLNTLNRFQNFAYFQLVADAGLTTFLIFFTGGSQSIFTIIYFFPIITGSLILFRLGGLLLAAVCTLVFGGLLFLELNGFYYSGFLYAFRLSPLANFNLLLQTFAINGLTFFLVAILSSFLSVRLRRAEEALSRSVLNYDRLAILNQQILDDISTGIITVASNNTITSFNRAAEEITGYQAQHVLGKDINLMFPGLGTESNPGFRPVVELNRKDGKTIPVGYSWTRLNMPETEENSRVITMQDLSQIKEMEDKMHQAEKMATIGEMAAGIAHEFRNPLAAISGSAQILAQEVSVDEANQKLMHIIIRESDRLDSTIEDFLQFSKPAMPHKNLYRLKDQVHEVLDLLRKMPSWSNRYRIEVEVEDGFECFADADQLRQVFLNLIANACNAMQGYDRPGEIRICATEQKLEDGSETTVLTISNNGPPIPEHIRERIFEPFFTTRENGTGLGLAIVRQIVESHSGSIRVMNVSKDSGVRFELTLPLP